MINPTSLQFFSNSERVLRGFRRYFVVNAVEVIDVVVLVGKHEVAGTTRSIIQCVHARISHHFVSRYTVKDRLSLSYNPSKLQFFELLESFDILNLV